MSWEQEGFICRGESGVFRVDQGMRFYLGSACEGAKTGLIKGPLNDGISGRNHVEIVLRLLAKAGECGKGQDEMGT